VDNTELLILGALQSGFPLVPRPFRAVGEKLGLSETEVLRCVVALRRKGLIRRIGPVLDPEKVGRVGALAAMTVPAERLAEVAGAVSACPSVTHDYERVPLDGRCPYNLWFTLTAPSQVALAEVIEAIEKATGLPIIFLPVRRKFKIGVRFSLSESNG
jgi:DNA-binding Lrp family transcriptional regulator